MESQIDEIKAKTDIVELIGQSVKLVRAGRNFKGLCPFHNEKTPSFTVSPERGTWRCFGCGEHGDAITFLEKYESLSFMEALEQLANKAGVVLDKKKQDPAKRDRQQRLYDLLDLAASYFQYVLENHQSAKQAREYLQKRKITNLSSKEFTLGYAPNSWQSLRQFALKKGFTDLELSAAGLTSSNNSGRPYDRFRDRLMFPISDSLGRVVGFSGRALGDDTTAKYLNSPEGEIFHKGKLLFGLHQAKEGIRQHGRLVLVEGNVDLLSSRQAGVPEVVAPLGTALTSDQVAIIKKYTQNIYLAYDKDKAGQEAIWRSLPLLQQQQLDIKVIQLPYGNDPDECIQANPAKWRSVVDKAQDVFVYVLDRVSTKYDITTAKGKRSATEEITPFLAATPDSVTFSFLLHQAADVIGVEESILSQQIDMYRRNPTQINFYSEPKYPESEAHQPKPAPSQPRTLAPILSQQQILSGYLLSTILTTAPEDLSLKGLKTAVDELETAAFPPEYQSIIQAIKDQLQQHNSLNLNQLADRLSGDDLTTFEILNLTSFSSETQSPSPEARSAPGSSLTTSDIILPTATGQSLADQLLHAAIQLNLLYLKEQLSQITSQIKRATVLESGNQQDLKKQFTQISQKINEYQQKTNSKK